MVVTGGAREDPSVGGGPVFFLAFCIQIPQHDAPLRTREGFVRATGHPRRALMQRILEFTARDQSQHMRSIIEQRNILRFAEGGDLRDRLREEEKTLAHHYKLWRHLLD